MKLDTYKSAPSVKSMAYPSCILSKSSQREYEPSTWVQLLQRPNPFSFDEALLLCKQSEDEWIAWIPDHGEAVLNRSQFCLGS